MNELLLCCKHCGCESWIVLDGNAILITSQTSKTLPLLMNKSIIVASVDTSFTSTMTSAPIPSVAS